jgi:hypothetical protein
LPEVDPPVVVVVGPAGEVVEVERTVEVGDEDPDPQAAKPMAAMPNTHPKVQFRTLPFCPWLPIRFTPLLVLSRSPCCRPSSALHAVGEAHPNAA